MTRRRAKRLPGWCLATLAILLMSAGEIFALSTGGGDSGDLFLWAITLTFAGVGSVIASRHPNNAIGRIFLWAAITAGIAALAGSYADHWVDSGDGPALLGRTAAEYGDVSWAPWILLPSTFLLLLFPDGHLLSRRWRPVAWCAALGIAAAVVTQGLHAGPISDYPQVTNPYGVDSPVIDPLSGLALLLLAVGIAGSSVSLIIRFRRARGEERQQMKWLAFAGGVAGVCVIVFTALYDVVGEDVANGAIMLSVLGLPLAAGVAILRYRLYDIDVVINRTLVYGALTATLAARLPGLRAPAAASPERGHRRLGSRGRRLDARRRRTRSAPPERASRRVVDRRFFRRKYDAAADARSVLGPAAGPGRPRDAQRRAELCRAGHTPAGPRVAVAAERRLMAPGGCRSSSGRSASQSPWRRSSCWRWEPASRRRETPSDLAVLADCRSCSGRSRSAPSGRSSRRGSRRIRSARSSASWACCWDWAISRTSTPTTPYTSRHRFPPAKWRRGCRTLACRRDSACSPWLCCCSRTAGCRRAAGAPHSGSRSPAWR